MIEISEKLAEQKTDFYDDGFLRIEYNNYYVTWNGKILKPTRAEFLILSRLVQMSERFVSSEELWEIVWGHGKKFNSESMRVYMYHLRRLLEPLGMNIENMVFVGYRFIPYKKSS